MVQSNGVLEQFPEFQVYTLFDFDEDVSLDTTFKNILEIDARRIADSVIVIFNPTGGQALEYRIYATAKKSGTIPADNDDSWINILRDPLNVDDFDPDNYDHNLFRTIPAAKRNYESFTNQWSWVRVAVRVPTTTKTGIKIWHRGAAGV